MNGPRFEVYRSARRLMGGGDWRWRLRAANGRIVASGEGYTRKSDAYRACRGVFRAAQQLDVCEVER